MPMPRLPFYTGLEDMAMTQPAITIAAPALQRTFVLHKSAQSNITTTHLFYSSHGEFGTEFKCYITMYEVFLMYVLTHELWDCFEAWCKTATPGLVLSPIAWTALAAELVCICKCCSPAAQLAMVHCRSKMGSAGGSALHAGQGMSHNPRNPAESYFNVECCNGQRKG